MGRRATTSSANSASVPPDKNTDIPLELMRIVADAKRLVDAGEPRQHIEAMRDLRASVRACEMWKAW